jgi:multidrug transporter EmrE-like cation transporter
MTSEKLFYCGALVVAVIASVAANTAFKLAVASISSNSDKGAILQILSQVSFWAGLFFAALLLISYVSAIRGVAVSIAYVTLTSLAMVGLVVVDRGLFGVPVDIAKIFGMALAISGVWLMTRGA